MSFDKFGDLLDSGNWDAVVCRLPDGYRGKTWEEWDKYLSTCVLIIEGGPLSGQARDIAHFRNPHVYVTPKFKDASQGTVHGAKWVILTKDQSKVIFASDPHTSSDWEKKVQKMNEEDQVQPTGRSRVTVDIPRRTTIEGI
jgi:hypothetical protein